MGMTAGLAMATEALTVVVSAMAVFTKGAARRGAALTTNAIVTIGVSKRELFDCRDTE
jgi:hypothetical protein